MKIITFLTDFGMKSGYVAQMKGVVSSITDARLVDITHDIKPHDLREGAFVLQTTVSHFPVGSVHVAVVDPGVGTDRKGIIVTTKSHVLVGPDNGLLMPAAHFLGDFTVYEITNSKYMLNSVSNTFHGRDIFAPVAAHIIRGVAFEKIGRKTSDFVDMDFGRGEISGKNATGKVIYIDRFGNLVTSLKKTDLPGGKYLVHLNQKMVGLLKKTFGSVETGEPVCYINSFGYLEIAIREGSAAEYFEIDYFDESKILIAPV